MSVRIAGDKVHVEGVGDVADAEPLLSALIEDRSLTVDLGGATRLHSAIVQLLLALRPKIVGEPDDPFYATHILPHILVWLDTDKG